MFQNDMDRKMQFSMDKVKRAWEKGNGHTILSTGITGDDARMAKAVVDAGVSMLEPNHPALALARGYKGVTSMHEAEKIRHEITVSQMAEVTRGVRSVVGNDVYITVGIPGGFTEILPTPLTDEDFLMMSRRPTDCIHINPAFMIWSSWFRQPTDMDFAWTHISGFLRIYIHLVFRQNSRRKWQRSQNRWRALEPT